MMDIIRGIFQKTIDRRHKLMQVVAALCLAVSLLGIPAAHGQSEKPTERHTSRYYANRAEELEAQNAWDAAKQVIDEGLKLYPDDPDLRYLNGKYYYYSQRDLSKARYNLVKAVQESDHHWGARRVLVDVEDDSKHYSSAICYINELLEEQPYDRDLWQRKISLFGKMGNKVESDAALERLSRIYPNDTVLRNALNARNRENWNRRLNASNLGERISTLETYLNEDPDNLDYYMELSDLYIKMGDYQKSMNMAKRGLVRFPGNGRLVQRVSSLMSELGLYTRSLMFLKENGVGGTVLEGAMREAANDARLHDPYDITGRLYATSGDRESLTYLLNTSLTRNYYDDAMMYLYEMYKLEGRTTDLLLKEYDLQKRNGYEKLANQVLEELYRLNPENEEFQEQYVLMQMELANIDFEQEDWEDAYDRLTLANRVMETGSPQWVATVARRISLLGMLDREEEAKRLYATSIIDAPASKKRLSGAYENIYSNRLKGLIEEERYGEALNVARELLLMVPDSEVALRACINMSQTLKRQDLFYEYALQGYEAYPEQPYFIIKQALALQQQDKYPEALALLLPQKPGELYAMPQLVNPYAGVSQDWAIMLLHNKMPDLAIERLDNALIYDPENTELLYLKGLAYENLKDFKEAYYYQSRYYNPSNAEQSDWNEHMRYLRFRSFTNRIDLTYYTAYHDTRNEEIASVGHLYSLASLSYSHLWKNFTWTNQISYKGSDGYHAIGGYERGGVGLEFMEMIEWAITRRWTVTLSGAYATNLFNKISGNAGFTFAANRGWTLGLKGGYRRTLPMYLYSRGDTEWHEEYKRYNMGIITPSVEKSWERIKLTGTLDFITLDLTNFYYNVNLKGKLFINEDNISSVSALIGFGSFPELTFFDQNTMNGISNINAMVGVEGTYLLTKNLYLSVAGMWNTYYNPAFLPAGYAVSSYRNIYSINAGLHLAF